MIPVVIAAIILIVILILSLTVRRVVSELSTSASYYLPPVSIAKLSNELRTYVVSATAMVETLTESARRISDCEHQILNQMSLVEQLNVSLSETLRRESVRWISAYGPEMFEHIIRDASTRLSNHLEMELVDSSTKLAGEYVLLHAVKDLDLKVTLEARYVDPELIRQTLIQLLTWQPVKERVVRNERDLRDMFIEQTKSRHELDLLLGKLGEHLQKLKWEGCLALKTSEVKCA